MPNLFILPELINMKSEHRGAACLLPCLVCPGITGWAQINGRNAISWEDKFKLDVWYVDNQSLLLDIKILWLTLRKVLVRDGISAEGEATMTRFTGSAR